jgi:uncharacterized protein YeaO (DUF488 family)
MSQFRTKSVYQEREPGDGWRVLVMRMWPRGIRKSHFDEWNRDVAPSRELVFAYKREGLPWTTYAQRYRAEIRPEALAALRKRPGPLTLLCGCRDETQCHRTLLKEMLEKP